MKVLQPNRLFLSLLFFTWVFFCRTFYNPDTGKHKYTAYSGQSNVEPGAGNKIFTTALQLDYLAAGASKTIYPDQWGATGIQADADDGEEDGRVAGKMAVGHNGGNGTDDRDFNGL